tara:strand:- start:34 stop:282 length:249 start_codon:yes stop_codon:yes gene_type:complete
MTKTYLIDKVYEIANCYDPDIDDTTSFIDIIKTLELMKDKALKFEILERSFKPEPQLPNFDNSPERFKQLAKDRMSQRQGEL